MADQPIAHRDFFISRAGEDRDLARYIDLVLRKAGYATFIQDHDFGHTSFMARMAEGFEMVERGASVVALMSAAYLAKDYCLKEAHYPLTGDAQNRLQKLIVFRIEDCAPTGFLKDLPYVDLVPVLHDEAAFRRAVLGAVDPVRFREEASFAAILRRTGQQIIHPEVRAVPGFAVRAAETAAIEAALWGGAGQPVAITDVARGVASRNATGSTAAVRGLGGVGKSVLAQQYAWDNRARYQGVWWLRAETRETLLDDLVTLGSRFIAGLAEMPDRAAAAHLTLDHIAQQPWGKPWLLVYDNVESPDAIASLTPANGAHVLATTRWADWYGHAAEVPVGVFTPEVAVAFLLERARGAVERPAETRAQAQELATDLGHLPLALAIARAHAWGMNWSLAQYRTHYAAMLDRQPTKAVDYPRSVAATFTLAIDRAVASSPEAERLLGLMSFLAPDAIPLDIITADVMSAIEKGEAVAALSEVSLVTPETLPDGAPAVSVHRLLQQVMRGRLGEAAAETAALATRAVAEAYPSGDRDPSDVRNWPACRRLEAHAMAVLDHAPNEGEWAQSTALLLNQHALHLNARSDHAAAEPLMRRALAIDEASFGPDHPVVAIDLNNLAHLLQATARLAEAEPLMRRALAIDEASFGPDHPDVARDLNNLALLLQATARLAEAEPLMRRALAINEASFGPDHPVVAIRLNNLATLLQATARLAEAEPLMRRALAIDEASFGPDHPVVARALNNLATLLQATARLAEAEPLMRRALAIDEASFGPDHPDVAIRLNNLAQLLQATARLAEAEPLMRQALAIDEASFGPDHPDVARDLNNLAQLLKATARLAEAEPLMRRVVVIFETTYGEMHPNVATALNNLATLLQATARLADAEPLMRRALAIDEASFGPDHPDVAIDLNNLAQLLQATARLAEAEPLMRRAANIFESSLGADHPSTRTVTANLARLLDAIAAAEAGALPDPPADLVAPPHPALIAPASPSRGEARADRRTGGLFARLGKWLGRG